MRRLGFIGSRHKGYVKHEALVRTTLGVAGLVQGMRLKEIMW